MNDRGDLLPVALRVPAYLNRVDLTGTHGLLQLFEGQHAGHAGFLRLSNMRPRGNQIPRGRSMLPSLHQISPTAFSCARISASRFAINSPIGGPWKRLFSNANQTIAVKIKKPTVM
jgi:hypothetical protein